MSFFHTQAPIIEPHHDHSYSSSGSTINDSDELDLETATLIANFALDNLDDFKDQVSSNGKTHVDSLHEIAYLLQWEQFSQWLSNVADAKLAKSTDSIDSDLAANAAYLEAFITAEEAAVEDRIAAKLLARGEALPPPKRCQRRLEHPDFLMDPEPFTVPGMEDTQSDQAGPYYVSSSDDYETVDNKSMYGELVESDSDEIPGLVPISTAQLKHSNESVESDSDEILAPFPTAQFKHSSAVGKHPIDGRVNCVSCLESCRYFETLKTPCDHYYCTDCLVALVEAFTRDEFLFPLRCCEVSIPVAKVLPTLSLPLRSLFERKNTEFSVPAGDRLYCSNPNCATFLGSPEDRLFASAVKCPHCLVNTCPRCKEPAHPGEGCGVGALQALAICEDWQTCPGCKTVVELNEGCNHITCRCKAEFCYLCAAPWKTCNCAQ